MFEEVPEQLKIADHIRRTPYYDDCKVFIDGIFEIANKFQLSLKDLPSAESLSPAMRPAFQAMLGLAAQNLRSLIMIAKAASEGFVEDVLILNRAVYERHLSILLIGRDPEKRGPQYLRSLSIIWLSWLERSESSIGDVHLEWVLNYEETIRIEAAQFMRDYFPQEQKPPQYWHGMNIKNAAEEVGLQNQYELGYRYMSEYAHAQGHSIPAGSGTTPFEIVRNRPRSELVGDIAASAVALFLRGWGELAKRFHPGELDQIKTLLRHYAKIAFPDADGEVEL